MFGVEQREHETRYDYAQEWLDAVKRAWTEPGDFDFEAASSSSRACARFPSLTASTRPLIMNAGSSAPARRSRCATAMRSSPRPSRLAASLEATAKKVQEVKAQARAFGREIEVYTVGQVICRRRRRRPRSTTTTPTSRTPTGARSSACWRCKNITPAEHAARRVRGGSGDISPARDRRLSLRRHARQGGRGARHRQPRGRARHRGLVRQLSRRAAVFRDEVLPRLQRMGLRTPN